MVPWPKPRIFAVDNRQWAARLTTSVSTTGTLNASVSNTYTRAGSFTVDKNGNLVNAAGSFLLGVPINQTTGLPTLTSPTVQSLSLVNVGTLTGIAKRTSSLSIALPIFAQSVSAKLPVRIFIESTRASLARMRWVSS